MHVLCPETLTVEDLLDFLSDLHPVEEILGCRIVNKKRQIFEVTLTTEKFKQKLAEEFKDHSYFNFKTFRMSVFTQEPHPPWELITLHPVPCEWESKEIVKWLEEYQIGKIRQTERCTHPKYPNIRNAFVRIYFEKVNRQNMPKEIQLQGQRITLLPSWEKETNLNCWKCNRPGHWATACPLAGKSGQSDNQHRNLNSKDYPPLQNLQRTPPQANKPPREATKETEKGEVPASTSEQVIQEKPPPTGDGDRPRHQRNSRSEATKRNRVSPQDKDKNLQDPSHKPKPKHHKPKNIYSSTDDENG